MKNQESKLPVRTFTNNVELEKAELNREINRALITVCASALISASFWFITNLCISITPLAIIFAVLTGVTGCFGGFAVKDVFSAQRRLWEIS